MAINTNYESSKDVPGGALRDTECLWLFCHIAIDERQSRTGMFGGRKKRERELNENKGKNTSFRDWLGEHTSERGKKSKNTM